MEYAQQWVNYLNGLRERQSNAQNNLAAAKRAAEEARQKYQSAHQKLTESEQFVDQVKRGNAGLDLALSAACQEKLKDLTVRENELRKKIEDLEKQAQALQQSAEEKKKTAGSMHFKYHVHAADALEWIFGKKLPPLDENSVRMAGRAFLDRRVGDFSWTFEAAKPSLFALNGSTEEEALVHFISDIWRSYSKTVPGRVLDFSVVDPTGLVRGRIGRASVDRMDFVQAYQEGFALWDTEGADESRVRGLFSREDVDALDRELESMQRSVQNFEREHFAAIQADPLVKRHGGADQLSSFDRVNVYIYRNENHAILRRYHVVVFLVPSEGQARGFRAQPEMDFMANLILRGNTAEFGFVPILLVNGNERPDSRWQSLIDAVQKYGSRAVFFLFEVRH